MIAPAGPSLTRAAAPTILVVDDDRAVADTFARMLSIEGFGVATALSADAAFAITSTTRPDAIILDMRMPITTGLQFLRRLRSNAALASIPVAIVTGDYFLSDRIQDELRSLGAVVRYKPLWLDELIHLARTLLDHPAA